MEIRMIKALAFVPPGEVLEYFEAAYGALEFAESKKLAKWFKRNYLGSSSSRPRYSPDFWTTGAASETSFPRTQNSVEEWHRWLKVVVSQRHASIVVFLMANRENMAENEEKILEQWLNDELSIDEEEFEPNLGSVRNNSPNNHSENDFSDSGEEFLLTSDHDSNSDLSEDEEEDEAEAEVIEENTSGYFYGKNRFKWARAPPARNARVRSHNIIRLPGTTSRARPIDPYNPKESFEKIFDVDIKNTILKWTNIKMAALRIKYKSMDRFELRDCTEQELDAFLGLLIYSAVFKSNHEAVASLFATDGTGRDIFRLCMSSLRFYTLLLCLRFNNPEDRNDRKKTDPGCIVTDIINIFNKNSQANYSIGANATIDEMLVGFRGRCAFKMYIPSKPNKYGLKMQCLADSKTHYALNTYLYCGKNSDGLTLTAEERKFPIPVQACVRLCKPILNSNRNITTDNWYTSMELVNIMKSKGLTVVGTMRKNKREISKDFLPHKSRQVGSSLFGFTKDTTMVSFVPKKNKSVVLVSSMHHNNTVDDNTSKPEIILHYNSTKGGVDSVDQMCSVYSSSRRTRRWPMPVFYRLLDMSTLNAYIIQQSHERAAKMTRMMFLKGLAKIMCEPHMKERYYTQKLPVQLRMSIGTILKLQPVAQDSDESLKLERNKRKSCSLCPPNKKAKTVHLCGKCKMPICLTCSKPVCFSCL
ncbi:piggyBac transposable element-derived protein 4-like [Eupeodes corollae]|uniref:piggyBac transposable element-derived protein 4-like n=1 Tax=Eupeodes corollae TaxID=290404 RepID=UPI0024900AE3|nr:piggyBac transposable element-derived protein 4-like [Eupeodes corollae]